MSIVQAMMGVVAQAPAGASNGLLNGLEHYYTLDNTPNDAHGSIDGTATNMAYDASDKVVGTHSGDFNGTSSSISLGDALSPGSGDFTISFWYKSTQTATNREIYTNFQTTGPHVRVGHNYSAGKLKVYFFNGTSQNSIDSTATINDGTWKMITVARDMTAGKGYIYVNGVEDTNWTSVTGSLNNTQADSIGSRNSGSYYEGLLDGLGIRSRALSSDDITTLYNSGAGLPYSSFTT